jgi:hypothetical protein
MNTQTLDTRRAETTTAQAAATSVPGQTTAARESSSAPAQTSTAETRAQTAAVSSTRDAHPPSPLDRLAMRVGLALVLWSRREHGNRREHGSRREHGNRREHRSRRDRDAQWRLTAHRNRLERERQAREQRWLTGVDELSRR